MAFDKDNFITDSGANTNAPRINRYKENATLAAMKAANYFNLAVSGASGGGYGLREDDLILVSGSDGVSFLSMTIDASDNATVAFANDFA
tara:strand:+ start:467 stop:736 length:270 start_codon:yes stop_codon:yes gene_type:complete